MERPTRGVSAARNSYTAYTPTTAYQTYWTFYRTPVYLYYPNTSGTVSTATIYRFEYFNDLGGFNDGIFSSSASPANASEDRLAYPTLTYPSGYTVYGWTTSARFIHTYIYTSTVQLLADHISDGNIRYCVHVYIHTLRILLLHGLQSIQPEDTQVRIRPEDRITPMPTSLHPTLD